MQINREGLELIKRFEGLRLDAYQDVAGIWTIGYGHTRTAREGMTITEAQAEDLLRSDLKDAEGAVSRMVKVPVSDNEFSALVSLVFNIGAGAFASSTVLRKLNAGDKRGAADAILMWNRSTVGGKKVVIEGLVRRRQAERTLFLTPVPTFMEEAKPKSGTGATQSNDATRPSAAPAGETAPPKTYTPDRPASGPNLGGIAAPATAVAGGGAAAGTGAAAVSHPENPLVQWASQTLGPHMEQILLAIAVATLLAALYALHILFFAPDSRSTS